MPSSARLSGGKEHQALVADFLLDEVAASQGPFQRGVYNFFFDDQELTSLLPERLDRQGAVAVTGRLQQGMAQARAGADERGDADLLLDLVGGFEAACGGALTQNVVVGFDLLNRAIAVLIMAQRRIGRSK